MAATITAPETSKAIADSGVAAEEPKTNMSTGRDLADEKWKLPDADAGVDIDAEYPVSPRITYWRFILDQPLITPSVMSGEYSGSGTATDPYVVVWIDKDPRNPMHLPTGLKIIITALVAILTLTASLVSSTYAGCIEQIMEDFGTGHELTTLGIALYVLGFGVGPIFWAPLSETQGRQLIHFISFGCFVAFNAGSIASQNIQTLLVLRFFSGTSSASALTNTGGVISDIFPANRRGMAMSLFAAGPFMYVL